MRILPGGLEDQAVLDLIQLHRTRALAVTPLCSAHALDISGLKAPEVSFWSAWDGDLLLGIGALKRLDATHGEVKSMHTAEVARRRGVGSAMLRHIMGAAREQGMRRLSLETGAMDYFAPARALYARHGFVECPPFGDYRPDPNSVFMTLDLVGSGRLCA